MAMSQVFTVTSPRGGDFLGRTQQLQFTVTGGRVRSTVTARLVNVANPLISFTRQRDFTPSANGEINGSIDLNFDRSTPEGLYRLEVTINEPGTSYPQGGPGNPIVITNITIDVTEPKFLDSNPINGAFVKGTVPIIFAIQEPNVDQWRVTVNGTDIPNNTGNSTDVNLLWNTAGIDRDGQQSITINVEDRAKNNATKSISVTLDRVAPSIQVISPTSTPIRRGTRVPVSITVQDQFFGAIRPEAVDVEIRSMGGALLGRVARVSTRNNGNNLIWTGRIRTTRTMPSPFRIRATAVDRAGNPAVTQEVTVTLN